MIYETWHLVKNFLNIPSYGAIYFAIMKYVKCFYSAFKFAISTSNQQHSVLVQEYVRNCLNDLQEMVTYITESTIVCNISVKLQARFNDFFFDQKYINCCLWYLCWARESFRFSEEVCKWHCHKHCHISSKKYLIP